VAWAQGSGEVCFIRALRRLGEDHKAGMPGGDSDTRGRYISLGDSTPPYADISCAYTGET